MRRAKARSAGEQVWDAHGFIYTPSVPADMQPYASIGSGTRAGLASSTEGDHARSSTRRDARGNVRIAQPGGAWFAVSAQKERHQRRQRLGASRARKLLTWPHPRAFAERVTRLATARDSTGQVGGPALGPRAVRPVARARHVSTARGRLRGIEISGD